jgi:hypothetical protein
MIIVRQGLKMVTKTAFIDHDDLIEALATNRSDQSFDIRTLPVIRPVSGKQHWCGVREIATLRDAGCRAPEHVSATAVMITFRVCLAPVVISFPRSRWGEPLSVACLLML